MDHQAKIFSILVDQDEVTWQRLLYELVKTEGMDPWDIDVSKLARTYIDTIHKLKEMDFRISGKVLLAAAILLKIKSNRLLNEDLSDFDRLLTAQDELADQLDLEDAPVHRERGETPPLIPRTPQPRQRKVSIFDLVEALEKALEVKQRRVLNSIPPLNVAAPKKKIDITQAIRDVYVRIRAFIGLGKTSVSFSKLTPSDKKEDKVYTLIPLLHLTNERKVALQQKEAFGEIEVSLRSEKEIEAEMKGEA